MADDPGGEAPGSAVEAASLTSQEATIAAPPYLGRAGSLRGRADRRADGVALGLGVQLALTDAELCKSSLDRAVATGHRFGE
jgi:hypothetical protein